MRPSFIIGAAIGSFGWGIIQGYAFASSLFGFCGALALGFILTKLGVLPQ
jgi:hypothetical protein